MALLESELVRSFSNDTPAIPELSKGIFQPMIISRPRLTAKKHLYFAVVLAHLAMDAVKLSVLLFFKRLFTTR